MSAKDVSKLLNYKDLVPDGGGNTTGTEGNTGMVPAGIPVPKYNDIVDTNVPTNTGSGNSSEVDKDTLIEAINNLQDTYKYGDIVGTGTNPVGSVVPLSVRGIFGNFKGSGVTGGGKTEVEFGEGSADTGSEGSSASEKPLTFEEWYANTKDSANKAYSYNVANAQTNRDQAYINAQNAYDQSKSEYGSNAAALGAMGLTGSGFSDYLNSRAYAQKQGDINAANRTYQTSVDTAAIARDEAIADADYKYMQYVEQKDTEKKGAYSTLYNAILADPTAVSDVYLNNMAAQYDLDEESISQLKAARETAIGELLDQVDYGKDTLDKYLDPNSETYQKYLDKLITGQNVASPDFFKESGELIDAEAAYNIYSEVKNIISERIRYCNAQAQSATDAATKSTYEAQASKLQEQLDGLTSNYNARYGVNMQAVNYQPSVVFEKDFGGGTEATPGNDFTLTHTYEKNGKQDYNIIRVEFSGKDILESLSGSMTEKDAMAFTTALTEKVPDGGVFAYTLSNGSKKYYVRVGQKFWEIAPRPHKSTSWNDLQNIFVNVNTDSGNSTTNSSSPSNNVWGWG